MKTIITSVALLAFSLGAMAQQDNTDQLQQEPPRETQVQVERAATRDAQKDDAEKRQQEADARKKAIEADQKQAELKMNQEAKDDKSKEKSKTKSKK